VKREDDHTAVDIVGSDSVILVNNHDSGIENKNNKDDDDAASMNVQEEQLPVPADCCAGSKSDAQHPLQPVKTTAGVRRKPSNQDASAPQKRKKTKKDVTTHSTKSDRFDDWCKQLLQFKEEFGHCNVPRRYSRNKSLGYWCSKIRSAYKKIQVGGNPLCNLSPEMIERLEKIGFQWQVVDYDGAFEKHCVDLEVFKEEFGHCNVPVKYSKNKSFGNWCNNIRSAYKKIQEGRNPRCNLSQDRIERLEKIGFQWTNPIYFEEFEKRCFDLEAFKEEFGHCNVPRRYPKNTALANWCSNKRSAYKKIQQEGIKPSCSLSRDRIDRLEKIGFQWQVCDGTFEKRCFELEAFKEEFGHCNVPVKYPKNLSFANWCHAMRYSYKQIKKGLKPRYSLSPAMIEGLETIGLVSINDYFDS